MQEKESLENSARRPYQAPRIERVVLDPIKEMLAACAPVQGGKNDAGCTAPAPFS